MKPRQEYMDELIARDPEGFERWGRIFPYASIATVVTYGLYVIIALSHVLTTHEFTLSLLKVAAVLFVLTGFLQTALYMIWRDRSALYMIGTCATMLAAQMLAFLWTPRFSGELLLHITVWSALTGSSVYLAWKALQHSKEISLIQHRRAGAAYHRAMKGRVKDMEKFNDRRSED